MSRLGSAVRERVASAKSAFKFPGVAVLSGWAVFLFWVNVIGCGGFSGFVGFPLPYETWSDYKWPLVVQYPWAIPVDIAFAACSIAFIVTLVCRRAVRSDSSGMAERSKRHCSGERVDG
jgi:hypothetical protein